MKMIKQLLALTLALMLCALPALAETTPEDVLATVNGIAVTRDTYDSFYQQIEDTYAYYGIDVTDPEIMPYLQQEALLNAMQYAYLDEVIAKNGLALTDEEAADAAQLAREDWQLQVEMIVEQYGMYGLADISTEEKRAAVMLEVLDQLEDSGITEATHIADTVQNALYDKAYLWIVGGVTVTEEEVRARYDSLVEADRVAYENDVAAYENMKRSNDYYLMYGMTDYYVDLYYTPAGYRTVTHILLEADDTALANYTALNGQGAPAEEVAAAREAVLASVQPQVEEIKAKMAEGIAFADLIPLYTMDPGMQDAAAIAAGYQVHPQSIMWVEEFRDAAFTMGNIGDISAPVVTDYGVHVLYYAADVPGGPKPYTEEVQALLHEELLTARQSSAYSESYQAWLEEAEIVYSDEALAFMSAE